MNNLEEHKMVMLQEFIEENWTKFVDKVGSEEEAEKIVDKLNV